MGLVVQQTHFKRDNFYLFTWIFPPTETNILLLNLLPFFFTVDNQQRMDGWMDGRSNTHIVICLRKCPNFAVFLCSMVLRISYKSSKYVFYLKRLKRKNFMSKSWHETAYVLGAEQGILWSRLWQFVASVSGWEKPLFLFFFPQWS